jgi:uncharacterized membrane protein
MPLTWDWITAARAVHILSIVHWIGGLAVVTTIVLPNARRTGSPGSALTVFESFERRFAAQARWSVALAGASGGYMFARTYGWDGLFEPSLWWIHLMMAVWFIFVLMLFVFEPMLLHDLFRRFALKQPERAYSLAIRLHWLALAASAVAIAAGMMGAHGAIG